MPRPLLLAPALVLAAAPALLAQTAGQQKLSALEGSLSTGPLPGDRFGWSCAAPGDLDGDGVPDLVVGAPQSDVLGPRRGGIWLLHLAPDGTSKTWRRIDAVHGNLAGPLDDGDRFGSSLASLGDLDGDGVPDLAVGAPRDDDGATDAGAVWVLLLAPDGSVASERKISATSGGFAGTLGAGDSFGDAVAAIGDVDGDGVGDLAVGAPLDDGGGADRGAVWVCLLEPDGSVRDERRIGHQAGGFGGRLDDVDRFGTALAPLGDLNGDGVPDLAVGADGDDDGGTNRGAVWILFLAPDGSVASWTKVGAATAALAGALDDADRFGTSLASLGTVDGGPWEVLAVGAIQDDDGGADCGATWLVSLDGGGGARLARKLSATQGGFGGDLDEHDFFGESVVLVGDVDGDGVGDLAVGADRDDDGGADAGSAWILFLGGFAAVDLRTGAGLNDTCLFSMSLPVLGSTWIPTVFSTHVPGAASTLVVAYPEALDPPHVWTGGELFVDPASGILWWSMRPVAGPVGFHAMAIPADPSLAGYRFHAQAAVLGGVQLSTCNGLDVVLGF